MSRLVPIGHKALFKILEGLGFVLKRQKGSHTIWAHPDRRTTVVPVHPGEDIGMGLLGKILADMELSWEEFEKLRK